MVALAEFFEAEAPSGPPSPFGAVADSAVAVEDDSEFDG